MKNIYLFSGLGADERVFQYMDFSGFNIHFIQWITPQTKESMEQYARRLTEQINTHKPILIGLSFGGMLAVEVAKLIDTEKIILISSAKTKKEIPFYYKAAGKLKLNRIFPFKSIKHTKIFNNWFLGAKGDADKKLLSDFLQNIDTPFLKWAIEAILSWKNETLHSNLKHIHGTADRILPFRFAQCDIVVNGGGHFMTVNKAEELTEKVRTLLAE